MQYRAHIESLIRFGMTGYRFWMFREMPDGSGEAITGPLTIKHFERGRFISESDSLLDDSKTPTDYVKPFLQACVDAAWEIGIRPAQLEQNKNELQAVRYHLEDMRQLAGVKK